MNEPYRGESDPNHGGAEPTTVLPETAAQLVEMERLQQALATAEERAKNHWEQYLRAVADVENVRKRAQKDVEAAHRYGIDKLAAELRAGTDPGGPPGTKKREGKSINGGGVPGRKK